MILLIVITSLKISWQHHDVDNHVSDDLKLVKNE